MSTKPTVSTTAAVSTRAIPSPPPVGAADVPVPPECLPGTVVTARGVTKTYRTGESVVYALRGVDLDIVAGEFLSVMGPSGNGKSTLLNCLSGLDRVDEGSVTVAGLDLAAAGDRRRARHRAEHMGFVFQNFNLIPVLSAVENVELPLLARGASRRGARERAMEALVEVGLGDRGGHRPNELSGGEQQRVAVARALAPEPDILWADEPTGALDSRTAGRVLDLLRAAHDRGRTLVVITHDPTVGRAGTRRVLVRDGRVEGQHTIEEVNR